MNSGGGNRLSKRLGFPIRKSPDQSLVADSPRHIAGSHVLHRLLMPRHPPYALKNLITLRHKKIGMNSDTRPEINYTNHEPRPSKGDHPFAVDARVHCAVLKKQTATTTNRRT